MARGLLVLLACATVLAAGASPARAARGARAAKDPWAAQAVQTTRPHHAGYRYLVRAPGALGRPKSLAQITTHLERNGVKLEAPTLARLAQRYVATAAEDVGELTDRRYASPDLARLLVGAHRDQLGSPEYLAARGPAPESGTLDPLHAEDVASIAVDLGRRAGFRGDALVLLRVASHLHDSDRSFPREMIQHEQAARGNPVLYARYKAAHQANSVARARDLLAIARLAGGRSSRRFERDLVALIGRHEVGGRPAATGRFGPAARTVLAKLRRQRFDHDRLTDVLRDADSTAFFTSNLVTYLGESGGDEAKLEQKIDYMFSRMGRASQDWVVANVVRSPTHLFGARGDTLTRDPLVLATRAVLHRYVATTAAGVAPKLTPR